MFRQSTDPVNRFVETFKMLELQGAIDRPEAMQRIVQTIQG